MIRLWRTPAVITASFALLLCVGIGAFSGVRAFTLTPFADPIVSPGPSRDTLAPERAHRPIAEAFAAAVARDPFHPERRASAERFTMPGSEASPEQTPALEPEAPGEVRLVGTAVVPGGRDFVMCRTGGERPLIVRMGERCGTLLLEAVRPQEARFKGDDGSVVVLYVPKSRTSQ